MDDKKNTIDPLQQAMQETLAENEKAAKTLIDAAQNELDKVNAQYLSAQKKLAAVKAQQDALMDGYFQQAVQSLKEDIAQREMADLAEYLLLHGQSVSQVAALLEAPAGLVSTIAQRLPNNSSAYWQDQER